jgi:hypothetical protein
MIWDPITGEPHQGPLKGHTDVIYSIACSPTRLHVASGSRDETIQVWDLQTGKPIYEPLRGHTSGIMVVAYSSDGNHILSSSDMTIKIWDSLTGTLIKMPLIGPTNIIFALAVSPDGKHIASGGLGKTIRVWDTQADMTPTEPLRSHTNFIQSSVASHIIKSALFNPQSIYDVLGLSQAIPFQSFWDPSAMQFKSIQLQQARITDADQSANDKPDQEVKDIEVTHSSHPLVVLGDGWLYTVDGGLLTHVPNEHWAAVCDMSMMCIPVTDLQGPPSERTQSDKIRDLKSLAKQYARDQGSCDDTRISYLEYVESEAEADWTLARMIAG